MADELLELFLIGDGFSHILKEGDHLVEDLSLQAGLPADAAGVVHDDDGQDGGDGELKAAAAVFDAGGGGQGADRGRMGAGHASAAHKPLRIEALVDAHVDDGFEYLGYQPAHDGCHEYPVLKQIAEKFHVVSPRRFYRNVFPCYHFTQFDGKIQQGDSSSRATLMCRKVTHGNLIDSSPLFPKNSGADFESCPAVFNCFVLCSPHPTSTWRQE